MARTIDKRVGAGGAVYGKDRSVRNVIELLNQVPDKEGGTKEKPLPLLLSPATLIAAIHRFQAHHFGMSTGAVDKDNVTISKLNEYESGRPSGPICLSPAMMAHVFVGVRHKIVACAKTMVGKVSKRKDSEGNRTGWRALKAIFEGAGITWLPENDFKNAGKDAAAIDALPGTNLAWCGIFATWALNQSGFNLKWIPGKAICHANGKKLDVVLARKGRERDLGATIGDVCQVDDTYNGQFLSHHVIVASHPDAQGYFDVIEGNFTDLTGSRQCIVDQNTRFGKLGKVAGQRRNVGELVLRYEIFKPTSL